MISSLYSRQVLLIIFVGIIIRLINIDMPLLEGAITRQLQTAETAYNFFSEGLNIFLPKLHVFPEPRYYILEFPIYSGIVGLLFKIFGPHDFLGRLVSVFAFAGTVWFIWLISSRRFNDSIGRAAAFIFSFLPLSIIFTRGFQPDPLALFFSTAAFYFFSEFYSEREKWFGLACGFSALAFLSKQTYAFILLPMCLFAFYRNGRRTLKNFRVYFLVVISLTPALLWTWHGKQINLEFPNYFTGPNLKYELWFNVEYFLRYDFYKNIFSWLTGVILTPIGFSLFILGLFVKFNRDSDQLILFWLIGVIVYNLLLPLHAFTHEYYHLALLPPASITIAKAWWYFFERKEGYQGFHLKYFKIVALMIFSISVAGYSSSGFRLPSSVKNFWQNTKTLNQNTLDDDRLIVMDRRFLYYGKNKGWVFHPETYHYKEVIEYYEKDENISANPINYLETLRRNGADYFFATKIEALEAIPTLAKHLRKKYPVTAEIEGINVLFNLKQKKK